MSMGRGTQILLMLMALFFTISGAWMVLELGGPRAAAIAKAAFSTHVLDGLADGSVPSSIPELHLHPAPEAQPGPGDQAPGSVEYLGTIYRARLAPLPGAHGWACTFVERAPVSAMAVSRLLRPGRLDLLGRAWALQVAGGMGVVVPVHRVMDVHVDGVHQGLMEWMETPGDGLERVRGVGHSAVALATAVELGAGLKPPTATGAPGDTILLALHHLLRDTLMEPALRDELIGDLLHMDAWLDLAAALHVVGGAEASPQLLVAVDPRAHRAYPVLADVHLAPVQGGEALQEVPLLRWLRSDADRAHAVAAIAATHMARLATDDGWLSWARSGIDQHWPAVVAQQDRRARISPHPQDVLPYGAWQWRHAHEALLDGVLDRWRTNGVNGANNANAHGTEQTR